jgi:hypothetical protein
MGHNQIINHFIPQENLTEKQIPHHLNYILKDVWMLSVKLKLTVERIVMPVNKMWNIDFWRINICNEIL